MKYLIPFITALILIGCDTRQEMPDKPYDGSMVIAVDENYKSVMSEQIRIFQNQYPKVNITAKYQNEIECIKDLMNNKVKMIFITRPFSPEELDVAKQNGLHVLTNDLARDGIALISSKNASNKNLKRQEVEKIFSESDPSNTTIIYENNNASNAIYFRDSVLKGKTMNPRSYSSGGIDSTFYYITEHPEAIGVVDMTNILHAPNEMVKSLINRVQIIGVKTDSSDYYWQPYPLYVASKSYPYTKSLYFILNEGWQGLGHSFANYLSKEPGQLLFHSYDLFPLKYNVVNREVQITHEDVF